uniref:Large ribosomal subunit protein uL13m n=1 Tax=Hucho hucho TaxID=62062 RepID=A0A4W5LVZ4_9TELE
MSSFTKSAQQWATFARSWYLIDARMQPPGKIATMCAIRLQGKHKPIYHALSDVGDHVVVMNTRHIAFSGNKWEQKMYSSHTQYPGGFKQVTATQLHLKDPKAVSIASQFIRYTCLVPGRITQLLQIGRLHDSCHSPSTSLINELFSPTGLPLTGCFLFVAPFSVNSRHCHV